MSELKNSESIKLNYINQYNSNDTNIESSLDSSQIDLKETTSQKLHKNYKYRIRTPPCIHNVKNKSKQNPKSSGRSKSSLKSKVKKLTKKLGLIKSPKVVRPKSALKKAKKMLNKAEKKEQAKEQLNKKRSKSVLVRFSDSYSAFNKIILEFIPVTVLVFGVPKNQKIDEIIERIDAHIDNRTFIRFKYNKKNGYLYIKFRNNFYYKFYCYYFKGKHYFKGTPSIKMIKIEEENGMWDINPKFEEEKDMTNFNGHQDNFLYKYYKFKFFRKNNT